MKANRKRGIVLGLMGLWVWITTGCEYDGPTAMYYQPQKQTVTPVIQSIDPEEAGPGVNYITIRGINFAENPLKCAVYFDGYKAEVVSNSSTEIQVRRPNRSGDSVAVKVVNYDALEIASRKYKITPVCEPYGGFLSSALTKAELAAIAVDKDETVYVVERYESKRLYKILVGEEKTEIGTAGVTVTDMIVAPDGNLLLMSNAKDILKKDVNTGEETVWVSVPKKVSYGDFDSTGCFYAGGNKTDLYVIQPDLSVTPTGLYSKYNIQDVRVHNGYVYILAENSTPEPGNPRLGIWRHPIRADGLGERELFLDWAQTGEYTGAKPKEIEFSRNGTLYIGTDYTHPILMITPDQTKDILYKGIIPTSASRLTWGNQNYLYMIQGGNWNVLRLDMGELGSAYFGRQ